MAPAPARAAKPAASEPEEQRRRHIKLLELSDTDLLDLDARAGADDREELLPTLDLERLEEMCMGVAALRDQLLNTFLAEIGPRLGRLQAAVQGGDVAAVQREAHGLRGMMGTIGARAGSELFGSLETLAGAGDTTMVPALTRRAVLEANRAKRAIESLPFRNAA